MFGFGDGAAIHGGGAIVVPNTTAFFRLADANTVTLAAGKVSALADQSGNGNDVGQSNAALRLTYNASSVGGKPGMTGTASTVMNFATGLFPAGQETWCLAVVKAPAATQIIQTTGGQVFSTRTAAPIGGFTAVALNGGGNFICYGNAVDHVSQINTSPGPIYNYDGNGHSFEWHQVVGATPEFTADGVAQDVVVYFGIGDNTVSNDSGGSAAAYLGNYFGGSSGFLGDICEVRIGTGPLSAGSRAAWRSYVNSFYGI